MGKPTDVSDCGVYKITNLSNGEFYIGSSCRIKDRWATHRRARAKNSAIAAAIRKHGIKAFSFDVVCLCKRDELVLREREEIAKQRPHYNLIDATDSAGWSPKPEIRKKMSRAKTRNWEDPAFRSKVTSAIKAGQSSAEARGRMSTSAKRRSEGVDMGAKSRGKTHSDEAREKARARQTKKFEDAAEREKVGRFHRGRKRSEETRARLSAAIKAHWLKRRARAAGVADE